MEETIVLDLQTQRLGVLRFTLSAGPIGSKSCCTIRISGVNGEDGGSALESALTKKLTLDVEDLELKDALAGTKFDVPKAASWIAESAILAEHIQVITYLERNEAWNMKVTRISDFYNSFRPVAKEVMARARKACVMGHISKLSRFYRRAGEELDAEDLLLAWQRPIVREVMGS